MVSIRANTTELIKLTNLVIESKKLILKTTATCACLVTKVAAGGARGVRKCKSQMASSSSGSSKDKMCTERGKRDVAKNKSNAKKRLSDSMSRSARKKKDFHRRYVRGAAEIALNGVTAAQRIKSFRNIIWFSNLRQQIDEYEIIYTAYKTAVATSLTNLYINITDKYNQTWTNVSDTLSTALGTGFTQIEEFVIKVINERELYPNCAQFADAGLLLAAQFTNEIIKCKKEATAMFDDINIIATQTMINVTIIGNGFIAEEDRCLGLYAVSWWDIFMGYYRAKSKDAFVQCHNQVSIN
jgi:Special lobe-specific silk protein SSP160